MADVIRKSTNRFTKGLIMDFSPENTKNEVLTHALNATLLTFNGNELSLQNDMGNARVETAYLPEGYMPVGTCEYGGIIYIVSYNPLEDKSQIGCFPSPERNISSDELGIPKAMIDRTIFQTFINKDGESVPDGTINNTTHYVLLKNDNLNPGDKFLICTNSDIYNERLSDLWVEETGDFRLISNPIISLNVVSVEDSGKIIYLNSDIKQYTVDISDNTYKYHLLGKMGLNSDNEYEQATVDPDSYRDVLNSGYSVFKSKTSGRLAILAELVMIDSYSVTHSVVPKKDDYGDVVEGSFDVVIHTDIAPRVTSENFTLVPKLQYYYLQNSQGFIQVMKPTNVGDSGGYLQLSDDSWVKPMYTYDENGNVTTIKSDSFFGTSLSEIYTPTTDDISLKGNLRKTSQFNFPKPYSYHGRMQKYEGSVEDAGVNSIYTKFTEGKYHRIKGSQVVDNFRSYYIDEVQAKFYRYAGNSGQYTPVTEDVELDNIYEYYIKTYTMFYHDAQRDEKYRNTFLYKMISPPQVATDSVLLNASIEKFQSKTTTTYKEATEDDKQNISKLLEKNGNSYSNVILQPGETLDPNKTYYVAEVTTVLESIGTGIIDRNEVEGEIYYYPATKEFIPVPEDELEAYWDIETNPRNENDPFWGYKETFYWAESKESYEKATEDEILNYKEYGMELFYQSDYAYIDPNNFEVFLEKQESSQLLFITVPMDTYVIYDKFVPNSTWNYIEGYEKPTGTNEPADGFRDEGIISLYTVADFIPNNLSDDVSALQYGDLRLANLKIPSVVSVNGLDLPFKYQYTLVPCMNYGRLDHLAVSNTVDFSKLHAFNQSNFTTWKYHVDGDQLRLTFGADIFDTYEIDKVDGLVLEFYDAWGFAGSLEITDKKSYSGVFTKIIPLNSRDVLSLNRIIGSGYSTTFKRNINITLKRDEYGNRKDPEEFTFNGKDVTFGGYSQGWHYSDGTILSDEDNDCGTLYSNILYGVKTYLRVTKFKGTPEAYNDFIPKREFFLYTLPIYNDYFYSVNDFSTLANPKLDLVLTYKLQDLGIKVPYTGNNITNGYYEMDQTNISKYLSGTYEDGTTLDVIKYYKYSGTSNLYLEVGLKRDYQDLNISYDASINDIFTCNLRLIGDSSNSTFDVKYSDNTFGSSEQVLEYYHNSDNPLTLSVNNLGFGSIPGDGVFDNSTVKTIGQCNFIARQGNAPIPINYEFIVGYQANITNIISTEIPATTVCALCHVDENGVYNYEDFGVYESDGQFLSNAMFYNGGTSETEVFGICQLVKTTPGLVMTEQCTSVDKIETTAQESKYPRLLNTGEPLKQMSAHIGKLTFCQPHAHSMNENTGVNIYAYNNTLGISPGNGGWKKGDVEDGTDGWFDWMQDDCSGVLAKLDLFNTPKYNLSVNTKNSILRYGEFISALDYKTCSGKLYAYDTGDNFGSQTDSTYTMREFTGFTGEQVASFNKKMIETMKYVYAYNPDYNSLSVMVGDVSTQDRQVQFTSNLISSNSVLNFGDKTFNDYVYIGSISFSDYLKHLNICSEDSRGKKITISHIVEEDNVKKELPLPQLQLIPGLDYCGGPESNYLVTSLNYRTSVPIELEEELSFKASNNLVIQHENREREFIKGIPNKKALYGFDKTLKKLIQLDVSNYEIGSDGKLTLNNETVEGELSTSHNLSGENLTRTSSGITYSFPMSFSVDGEYEEVYLTLTSNLYTNIINGSANKLYIALPGSPGYGNSISVSSYIRANSSKNYSYRVTINSIEVECNGKLLNPNKISISDSTGSKPNLTTQNVGTLQALVSNAGYNVTLIGTTGTSISGYNTDFWVDSTGGSINKTNNSTTQPGFKFNTYGVNAIELYEVTLKKINFTITRYSVIADNPDSIVKVTRTSKYSLIKDNKYQVLSDYAGAQFIGTSLTINDLEYDGLSTGHRLFVRNNLYDNNDNDYRNIIYYRSLEPSDWGVDTENKNHLFILTGPCFTTI